MTEATSKAVEAPANLPRSVGAVVAGLGAVFVLSLGTDQVLHWLGVYPPWGVPMHDTRLNLIALSYRVVYGVLGPMITAHFAPRRPLRHALVLGGIGVILSIGGVGAAMQSDLGPLWYPVSLVVLALPSAWLGGVLHNAWCRHAADGRPA